MPLILLWLNQSKQNRPDSNYPTAARDKRQAICIPARMEYLKSNPFMSLLQIHFTDSNLTDQVEVLFTMCFARAMFRRSR